MHTDQLNRTPVPMHTPSTAWAIRPWQGPHEYAAMAAVFAAAAAADHLDGAVTAAVMAAMDQPSERFEPTRDILLAEADRQVVALARCEPVVEAGGRAVGHIFGTVYPAWRDRGIGTQLLRRAEHLLRDRLLAPSAAQAHLVVWSDDAVQTARRLFAAEGYVPVRYTLTMHRALDTTDLTTAVPAGLEVRPAAPAHERVIRRALLEAFQEHWGMHLQEADLDIWQRMPDFDPSLWQVAWDGDEVAGMVLDSIDAAENTAFGRARGYTDNIAVREPWRGRGLATALIGRSLDELRRRGMTEAVLHVDTQNANNALGLYERCDYQVARRHTRYRKAVGRGPAGA